MKTRLSKILYDKGWTEMDLSRRTGHLEGAQPLFDLAAALFLPGPPLAGGGYLLAVSASPSGVHGATLLRTDRPPSSPPPRAQDV